MAEPQVQTLGGQIARLRTKARITLRKFAGCVGISAAHQSDIEHNRRRPSRDLLERIVKELQHVGASFEAFDLLDSRLEPEIQQWVSETPAIRQLLRTMKSSKVDPREVLKQLEERARRGKQ